MSGYLKIVYNKKDRPYTDYPAKLTKYLYDRYQMSEGQKLLDVGCGRGEFLKGFMRLGLDVKGVDISPEALEFNRDCDIKIVDIENSKIPFEDNTFDIIYSKSVLEHFYYPERYMTEVYRILKPNGILLTMVPEWESNYKIYYDDYTHRTPFTLISLGHIYLMHNFKSVQVERFRQLPFLWRHPYLKPFCALMGKVMPRSDIKLIRFSKEVMLLASGRK